ncbi:MAG: hypothetical protein E6248_00375 [Clostridium sp.]|nr:hypothetical protein [Clostridium sp.]MDU5108871.1 hypothetical protein [Clostridium sp.]
MNEWLEEFEEILDKVVSIGDIKDFETFKRRVIEVLEEVDQ